MNIPEILRLAQEYATHTPDRIALSKTIGSDAEERRAVALQVSLSSSLRRKLPSWAEARVFIPHSLNLEQSSSEETALHKRRFVTKGDTLLDLTGGMGVDFWAMASVCKRGVYVEQDDALYEASAFNLPRLMHSEEHQYIRANSMEVLEELIQTYAPTLIFVDPARRINQQADQRVFAIEDCNPSLIDLQERLRALPRTSIPRLVAKLSPMLDVKHCLTRLQSVVAVWVVALKGEVKELLLELCPDVEPRPINDIPLYAVDLVGGEEQVFEGTFAEEQTPCPIAESLGTCLYEPNGSIMKLGLYHQVGRAFALKKLHQHTHLYTSTELIPSFPGRIFKVEQIYPYQSKVIKQLSRHIDGAQITCRNFPISADKLRQKLHLKENSKATIVATTLYDGSQVLIYTTRP